MPTTYLIRNTIPGGSERMDKNNGPALSRETIIERAIKSTSNAALDVWNELPVSIAAEVMETVIDRLITELVTLKESNAL